MFYNVLNIIEHSAKLKCNPLHNELERIALFHNIMKRSERSAMIQIFFSHSPRAISKNDYKRSERLITLLIITNRL